MSLTTFIVTYLVGGLTFLPLLLALVLVPAWLWLPLVQKVDVSKGDVHAVLGEEERAETEKLLKAQEEKYTGTAEGAASAMFAVLRTYHFAAATAALNARSGGSGTAGPNGALNGSVEMGSSESVYQSMYRSVFDRSKHATPASSALQTAGDEGGDGGTARTGWRKAVNASVFYIVLRHGHLMLYDSPAQIEVRHVVSLAHHSISLSEGGEPEREDNTMADGDLFIKRTAIVLTPIHHANGHDRPQSTRSKPFYFFSSNCSEKEDFYHALLTTRIPPPIPQPLPAEDIIKLQSTLHSTSLTPETRAFNALIGRVFLAIYRTPSLENLIRSKIEKKISRVQKPAFVASLAVTSISLGNAAPVLSNPRLKDINISGDMTVAFDVRYNGGVQVVIAAIAKLDLGARFKARTVDVVLSTSLQRLTGHMLVRIKPPPSNRIWFCFESAPDMEIKVEPVVSSRQITYTFILRAIEERIRSVMGETLVKPNWDDIPFFDTRAQNVRGGIWADEGVEGSDHGASRPQSAKSVNGPHFTAAERLGMQSEKARSTPALVAAAATVMDADSSAASSGSESVPATAASSALHEPPKNLKRRSTASLPAQSSQQGTSASVQQIPKPLRSPSFTSPSPSGPSVAVDSAMGMSVKADDATLQPKKWRSRAALQHPAARKEAVEAVREMKDRVMQSSAARHGASNILSEYDDPTGALSGEPDEPAVDVEGDDFLDVDEQASSPAGGASPIPDTPRRADTTQSTSQRRQEQRKNILAATAAATSAARNWSWNALATARARQQARGGHGAGAGTSGQSQQQTGLFRSGSTVSSAPGQQEIPQQPIGRGQPLPPPGTPLPGPEKPKTLWSAATGLGSLAGGGSVKRKPVLPPRRPTARSDISVTSIEGENIGSRPSSRRSENTNQLGNEVEQDSGSVVVDEVPAEDEFGPWSENSGMNVPVVDDPDAVLEGGDGSSQISADEVGAEGAHVRDGEHGETVSSAREAKPAAKVPPPLPARRRKPPSGVLGAGDSTAHAVGDYNDGLDTPARPGSSHRATQDHVHEVSYPAAPEDAGEAGEERRLAAAQTLPAAESKSLRPFEGSSSEVSEASEAQIPSAHWAL